MATRIASKDLHQYKEQRVTLVGAIEQSGDNSCILKEHSGIATLKGKHIPTNGIVQVQGTVNDQLHVLVDHVHVYDYSGTMEQSLSQYAQAINSQ